MVEERIQIGGKKRERKHNRKVAKMRRGEQEKVAKGKKKLGKILNKWIYIIYNNLIKWR